ncbi:hypothetical protein [Flavobacterium sp. UBA6046]|jgi:predicted DNA-binding protein|uniref:hypothetical protein n=1 Tax=Flavobacterium sp. UBA6046 TaxID=1946552 RepID=UPI0025C49347|nr:hypothetical protein [Flavobacterium sp. UBA6046]
MSKEKAADYFARHESSNECHVTSDGRVFHTKGAADGFANTLKDTKVTTHVRESIESKGEDQEDDTLKIEALEALKTFDTATAKYPELKALVKALGLETESQKQEVLVAAIEAQKGIINTEVQD